MHILRARVGVVYLTYTTRDRSTTKGPPTSNNSIHGADCKKSKLDFSVIKELVEQHVDSYRYSRASLHGPRVGHSTSLTGVASSSCV